MVLAYLHFRARRCCIAATVYPMGPPPPLDDPTVCATSNLLHLPQAATPQRGNAHWVSTAHTTTFWLFRVGLPQHRASIALTQQHLAEVHFMTVTPLITELLDMSEHTAVPCMRSIPCSFVSNTTGTNTKLTSKPAGTAAGSSAPLASHYVKSMHQLAHSQLETITRHISPGQGLNLNLCQQVHACARLRSQPKTRRHTVPLQYSSDSHLLP